MLVSFVTVCKCGGRNQDVKNGHKYVRTKMDGYEFVYIEMESQGSRMFLYQVIYMEQVE